MTNVLVVLHGEGRLGKDIIDSLSADQWLKVLEESPNDGPIERMATKKTLELANEE